MKKILITLSLALYTCNINAQMTAENSYNNVNSDVLNDADMEMEVINLSKSGHKYFVRDMKGKQLRIYNLNHSIWKTINLPAVNNYEPTYAAYTSEELFNSDAKVEVAVYYNSTLPSVFIKKLLVINEDGNIMNNIDSAGVLKVYSIGSSTYKAILQTGVEKFTVFSLPGTIPCDKCGNGLGLGKVESGGNIGSPIPNPSNNQTKIEYTLPVGSNQGEIDVFNLNGQKLKSYQVDKTFNSLLIDNSELPAGTYYYHLFADGERSDTKKMVVIK